MADGEARISATRGALLELKEERRLMQESYNFLDEKRILLATAILAELRQYQAKLDSFQALWRDAGSVLKAGIRRHGLEGLSVYPAPDAQRTTVAVESRNFLGLALVDATIDLDGGTAPIAAAPSPEANACREQARALLAQAPEVGAAARNIAVLSAEYTRTERRAKALENILLPDIEADLTVIEEQLEAIEQEEVLRVRNASERKS
jgi:V/A-type H+-transporting ATPase subunit D